MDNLTLIVIILISFIAGIWWNEFLQWAKKEFQKMTNNNILHWVAVVACFSIPVILQIHGQWQDITLGGALSAVYLYLSRFLPPVAGK